jgi:Flp pilus assembly protein TadG
MNNLLRPIRRHFESRSRGQSLVEFAMILPIFLLFFAAVLDLGRIAAAQVTVTNAAREGAFQASETPTDFDNTKSCPADASSNRVVCRTILEASGSVVSISPSDIALACAPSCASGMGNRVTVNVTGHFQLITPLLTPFFGGSQNITFTAASTHQVETLPPPPTAGVAITAPPSASPSGSVAPTASPAPTFGVCTLPSAGFTSSHSPSSRKAPVTLTVTDTSTSPNCGITSWFWQWGDGTTSTVKNPGSHLYLVAGTYSITLTVSNAAGSNTTGALILTVKP